MGLKKTIRSALMIAFFGMVFIGLIYSRMRAYSLAPTMKPASFKGLSWWQIPISYVIDYISHAWICLLFAFVVAGLVYEFVPKETFSRYMSSKRASGYIVAAVMAPLLTACSCTIIPVFAGILYAGAGIGPAIAFLLSSPAANVLTILITGELISWNLAIARVLFSILGSIVVGAVVMQTSSGKRVEQKYAVAKSEVVLDVKQPPLDERLWAALKFGGYLGKTILGPLFIGIIAVSYLEAYIPKNAVITYLTGMVGVLLGSVIGGPLYTPTLVEIVLARGLMDLGMSSSASLAFMMGQPYDIPSMAANAKLIGWKVVLIYASLFLVITILSGFTYGVARGELI